MSWKIIMLKWKKCFSTYDTTGFIFPALIQDRQKSWKWDHQRSSKMFHFNMMIFHDIWWFFVSFDDYWWFFMIKTGDLSWLIMVYHDWSWPITIQLGEVTLMYTSLRYMYAISNPSSGMGVVPLCLQHGTGKPRLFSLYGATHDKMSCKILKWSSVMLESNIFN